MDYCGFRFEQYQIIERLGQGGMAVVYKAYDARLERDVAIKVVRKESIPPEQLDRILKRFEREAKALARFLHPNIVPVYDYGEYQGAPYLVMAYLPGGNLKERIGKPVPAETALTWLEPIAGALSYAHQRGIIHRDVKPSNILITEDDMLMLSDFGIAQVLEQVNTQLTSTGMGVGTPEYMAPEQWKGEACEASDQYGLGVVLFELLTGQKPFTAETPLAVALKVMTDPLPQPSAIVVGIPEGVEKLIYKVLARQPEDRYEDMLHFQRIIKGLSDEKQLQEEGPTRAEEKVIHVVAEGVHPENRTTHDVEQKVTKAVSAVGITDAEIEAFDVEKENAQPDIRSSFTSEGETEDILEATPNIDTLYTDPKSIRRPEPQRTRYNQKPKTNKTGLIFGLSGIGFVLALGIISIFIVITGIPNTRPPQPHFVESLNLSATANVQTTTTVKAQTTAKAQETATARAQATTTAKAQVTATAQVAWDRFDEYAVVTNLVYEESFYELEHIEDNLVETYWTGIDLKNFALEVTFINPYDQSVGDWSNGIMFRDFYGNDQYRLFITSYGTWDFKNLAGEILSSVWGEVEIHTGGGAKNKMCLVALDDTGYFFVNDLFVAELDLSERNYSGDIRVATGFMNGHEVEGYATKFEELRIFSIKIDGIPSSVVEEQDLSFVVDLDLSNRNLNYQSGSKDHFHVFSASGVDHSKFNEDYYGIFVQYSNALEPELISDLSWKRDPIISPDGNFTAYLWWYEREGEWKGKVLLYDFNDKTTEELFDEGGYLSWSSDGRFLAICQYWGDIAIISLNSKSIKSIPFGGRCENFNLSPCGKMVVYLDRIGDHINDDDGWMPVIYNIENNQIYYLGDPNDGVGVYGPLLWTKEGDRVVFQQFSIDNEGERYDYQLVISDVEGKRIDKLTKPVEVIDQRRYPWVKIVSQGEDIYFP